MVKDIPKFFFSLPCRKRETHVRDILKIRFSINLPHAGDTAGNF